MASLLDSLTGSEAKKLVSQMEEIFKPLPKLPKGLVDFIVQVTPWLSALAGIFGVLGGISLLTSSRLGFMSPWSRLVGINRAYFVFIGIIQVLMGILLLLAFNSLKTHQLKGWMLLFWATTLSLCQVLLNLVYGLGGIIGLALSGILSFYILFQIKPKYK